MKIRKVAIMVLTVVVLVITGNIVYGANTISNKTNNTTSTSTTKKSTSQSNSKTKNSNKNTIEEEEKDQGLASLEIEGAKKISPEFKTTKYEYDVKYIGEDEKLQITATPTEPQYTVKIIGNSEIKEGDENLITILVSDSNDNNVATYQLNINKSLIDEEEVARQEKEMAEKHKKEVSIIICGVVITIFLFIILLISAIKSRIKERKKRKTKAKNKKTPKKNIKQNNNESIKNETKNDKVNDKKVENSTKKENIEKDNNTGSIENNENK